MKCLYQGAVTASQLELEIILSHASQQECSAVFCPFIQVLYLIKCVAKSQSLSLNVKKTENRVFLPLCSQAGLSKKVILVKEALSKLSKQQYSIEELTGKPLPEGVDPMRLEDYLSDQDFKVGHTLRLLKMRLCVAIRIIYYI